MTTRSLAAVAAAAVLTVAPLPPSALSAPAYAAAWTDCGEVSFSPGTTVGSGHYGVQKIRADRVACPTARKVAARAEREQGEPRYSFTGFTCVRKAGRDDGRTTYTCTKRSSGAMSARITFLGVGI
ncbi:hypothetical protein [Nocardioides sp. R-C-SC26]|uniref:hypothetical protein n=1 Tax=Nocardioides sp. R-C-SC26 TaxID=2870414 RepID=UPI001E349FDC|nr:hypothetical protein [Nocardioides sp. R-C-SC26]